MTTQKSPLDDVPEFREAVDHFFGASDASRREVLSVLTKVGMLSAAGAAVGGTIVAANDETAEAVGTEGGRSMTNPEHAWCMIIDLRHCDGCGGCDTACKTRHNLPEEQEWMKIYTLQDETGQDYWMPRPCMMCENPPCVRVCPVGANFVDDGGLVLVDQDACIGSRACMAACPYDARYFNWSEPPQEGHEGMEPSPIMPVPQQKGTVGKCVFCADRLPQGELPACVTGCPMGAIYIGDLVTDVAINSRQSTIKISQFLHENNAYRYREELGTAPRVWYIPGHGELSWM